MPVILRMAIADRRTNEMACSCSLGYHWQRADSDLDSTMSETPETAFNSPSQSEQMQGVCDSFVFRRDGGAGYSTRAYLRS
jgi:hypothetical protein